MNQPQINWQITLEELLKEQGYRQVKLAAVLQITEATFTRKKKNPEQFSLKELIELASFMTLPCEQILVAALRQVEQNRKKEAFSSLN